MIPKFRAWHNELGRMMSISDMWFNVDSLGEIGLNDAVMNDYITVSLRGILLQTVKMLCV